MLAIVEYAPRSLEMTLSGPLDETDMSRLESALERYTEDEGSISAVLDISQTDASPQTSARMAQLDEMRLLRQIDKMGRIAVVGGSPEMDTLVRAIDATLPTGSLARFSSSQKENARRFAAQLH